MSAPATKAVVRVRWARGVFTSGLMPIAEASDLAKNLRAEVVDCGTGYGFVEFKGHDGREVHVRGRDVVAIECAPDVPDRITPPRGGAGSAVPGAGSSTVITGARVEIHPGPVHPAPSDGTAFLRQQVGIAQQARA